MATRVGSHAVRTTSPMSAPRPIRRSKRIGASYASCAARLIRGGPPFRTSDVNPDDCARLRLLAPAAAIGALDADDAARLRAQAAFEEIVNTAIDLGGTVTGEHGVGLLKRAGMHRELGPAVLAMQRAVKAALDPHDILNPGKAVG